MIRQTTAVALGAFLQADAAEAVLAGDIPPDRAGMSALRMAFQAEAAARAQEALKKQCWRVVEPS